MRPMRVHCLFNCARKMFDSNETGLFWDLRLLKTEDFGQFLKKYKNKKIKHCANNLKFKHGSITISQFDFNNKNIKGI